MKKLFILVLIILMAGNALAFAEEPILLDSDYTITDLALLSAKSYILQIHFIIDAETDYSYTTEEKDINYTTDMLSIGEDIEAAYDACGLNSPVDVEVSIMYGVLEEEEIVYGEWSAWSNPVTWYPGENSSDDANEDTVEEADLEPEGEDATEETEEDIL